MIPTFNLVLLINACKILMVRLFSREKSLDKSCLIFLEQSRQLFLISALSSSILTKFRVIVSKYASHRTKMLCKLVTWNWKQNHSYSYLESRIRLCRGTTSVRGGWTICQLNFHWRILKERRSGIVFSPKEYFL